MSASTATANVIADTNVWVYAFDADAGSKHEAAKQLLRGLTEQERLVLTAQVLNEVYAVLTRPHRSVGITPDEAAQVVREIAMAYMVLPLTGATTLRALDAVSQHGLAFWDALIWATAKENNIAMIYSEDFQHGRDVEGVYFVNPFLEQDE